MKPRDFKLGADILSQKITLSSETIIFGTRSLSGRSFRICIRIRILPGCSIWIRIRIQLNSSFGIRILILILIESGYGSFLDPALFLEIFVVFQENFGAFFIQGGSLPLQI